MSERRLRRPHPSELELADRIEAVLRAASAVYERTDHEVEEPLEPHVDFRLATRPEHHLEMELSVGSDQLTICWDGAEAYLLAVAFEEEEDWTRTCVGAVDYLVRHDLRLKIWSGAFTTVGALRLGSNDTDWAGDLRAIRRGRERVYSHWLERRTETVDVLDPSLARIRAIVGREDVEWMDVVPDVALHDDEELRPVEVIRVGVRYFARMRGRPDEWWMGEIDDAGTLRVWGVYGTTLEEAVRHH